ncbi:hypothetical protein GH141_04035 [bacterium]|nr:hypothetical protein [bacterium]
MSGLVKFIWPNNTLYAIGSALLQAVAILAVVVYVIYTRDLAVATKDMAEAYKEMIEIERGDVQVELFADRVNPKDATEDVKTLSREIHTIDKELSIDEYKRYSSSSEIDGIVCRVLNRCPRKIDVKSIMLKIRHTGEKQFRDLLYEPPAARQEIPAMENQIFVVLFAPEGHVRIKAEYVKFQDAGKLRERLLTVDFTVKRIRYPESMQGRVNNA